MNIARQQRLQQIISQKSVKVADTGCWLWMGQVSNTGRGRLMVRDDAGVNRIMSSCDASYLAYCGEIPEGMSVDVSCGNRLCVNPGHLVLKQAGL